MAKQFKVHVRICVKWKDKEMRGKEGENTSRGEYMKENRICPSTSWIESVAVAISEYNPKRATTFEYC